MRIRARVAITTAILFASIGIACEKGADVVVHNLTATTIEVCEVPILPDKTLEPRCHPGLNPGESREVFYTLWMKQSIQIRDDAGLLIDEQVFTRDRLRAQGFVVVVTQDGIVPTEPGI